MKTRLLAAASVAALLFGLNAVSGDMPTKFSNRSSVANTRHNMTQSTTNPNIADWMDEARNDYGEVCVYCHTPHGANTKIAAPLWNRTIGSSTYTMYSSASLRGEVSLTPGVRSLTCLSCHDGTVAIDSVINMPGSGGYLQSQETSTNLTYLNSWKYQWKAGSPYTYSLSHSKLTSGHLNCLICHNSTSAGPDFTIANLGTNLTNDHPVGIDYSVAGELNQAYVARNGVAFFDTNSNSRPESNELRVYVSGEKLRVECTSCHDPHGVPSAGPGTQFTKSFLRIENTASALCLTCHIK